MKLRIRQKLPSEKRKPTDEREKVEKSFYASVANNTVGSERHHVGRSSVWPLSVNASFVYDAIYPYLMEGFQ